MNTACTMRRENTIALPAARPATTRGPPHAKVPGRPQQPINVRYMVDDVQAAIDFYTSHFGFTLRFTASPAFADVTRGNLRLLLAGPTSSAGRPMPDGRKPGPGGAGAGGAGAGGAGAHAGMRRRVAPLMHEAARAAAPAKERPRWSPRVRPGHSGCRGSSGCPACRVRARWAGDARSCRWSGRRRTGRSRRAPR
jgi:catechol 2,3-dioxygenase-like lactoylglutathione lyase family enzyme